MRRVRTAVLISGNGSNLQALIDASRAENYPAEIVLVISNVANVRGLLRASKTEIPSVVVPHGGYATREAYDNAVDAVLAQYKVELVCLAGFMRILSEAFVRQWEGRMINIHPSLLPNYKGLNTHARVLAAGEKEHGASVHWVTAELDSGAIILQKSIPVFAGESEESLTRRVHAVEHEIYPQALATVARGLF